MLERFLKNNLYVMYLLMWIAVAAVHFYLLWAGWNVASTYALMDSLVFNMLFAVLGAGLWFWTRYADLQKRHFLQLFLNHLAGSAITVFIWIIAGYALLRWIAPDNPSYNEFLDQSMMVRAISGVLFYLLLTAMFYLLTSYRELFEKTQRETKLITMLREAELNMLRSQIKPHFLFNSLNSINSLILKNPGHAQEMVIKLSEFMRYSLSHQDESMITLEKELYHMALYLEIERVRFSDRLLIEKSIDEDCLEQKLPAMILQPLLENAVKHGVYETTGKVEIAIQARIENNFLVIKVWNSVESADLRRKGTGTGLKNIAKRLQAIYGRNDLMIIRRENNTFEVELQIPLS